MILNKFCIILFFFTIAIISLQQFAIAVDLSTFTSQIVCNVGTAGATSVHQSTSCELRNVALFRNALYAFGIPDTDAERNRQSLQEYATCSEQRFLGVSQVHNVARRSECARMESVALFVIDDVLSLLHNASRGFAHTSIRASSTFRLHNEFILPLFLAVSLHLRSSNNASSSSATPSAAVFLPLCTARWWQAVLSHADRFHPDRHHLHHDVRVSSAAIDKLEMPTTPGSVLVRDQLHRWLSALRRLHPPSSTSVFDRQPSVQAVSNAHMQCVAHVHWGRGAPPFPQKHRALADIEWVRQYKQFVWNLYDLDTSTWKIGRPIAQRHLLDGDPLDLGPGGHRLDDDLHVALGLREHVEADVAAAEALANAVVRVVPDDIVARPPERRCVGCPGFTGTDAWCRCCGLDCGGFRQACVEKDGFCVSRCVGTRWCAAESPARKRGVAKPTPAEQKPIVPKLVRDVVPVDQKPIITLMSGSDRSLHLAATNIMHLSELARHVGFTLSLCCRTVYDHRELVRLMYNTDVLVGFAAGGALVNSLYLKEDALVVQLSSPEEQFADDIDKGTVEHMAAALKLRFLAIDGLVAQVTRQGLVFDQGALHTIVNRIKTKWRAH
jgi:hypothetical protein